MPLPAFLAALGPAFGALKGGAAAAGSGIASGAGAIGSKIGAFGNTGFGSSLFKGLGNQAGGMLAGGLFGGDDEQEALMAAQQGAPQVPVQNFSSQFFTPQTIGRRFN